MSPIYHEGLIKALEGNYSGAISLYKKDYVIYSKIMYKCIFTHKIILIGRSYERTYWYLFLLTKTFLLAILLVDLICIKPVILPIVALVKLGHNP